MTLNPESIAAAVDQLETYSRDVEYYASEIAHELADIGYEVAFSIMADHIYTGATIDNLEVVDAGGGRFLLRDESEALLFFEFGAGVTYGGGHPWDGELGMGPGTYPGQTHAMDAYNGWWYPTNDPALAVYTDKSGRMWGHTWGNPPHMPFYQADQEMRRQLLNVARRVFQSR